MNQKLSLVIGIVVVVALAVYFGFFREYDVSQLPSPTPTPSVATDAITDWQTYYNAKSGFKFKYPPNLTLYRNANNYPAVEIRSSESTMEVDFSGTVAYPSYSTEVQFGTNIGYQHDAPPERGSGVVRTIYLQKTTDGFLVVRLFGKWEKDVSIFDQILSTFRFTTVDPTAGWKTFSYLEEGVSFRTPLTWEAREISELFLAVVVDTSKTYTGVTTPTYNPSVSVTSRLDTFGGSIEAYEATLPASVRAIRSQQTMLIGGETAYVYRGVTPPTAHDFRVVFANNTVYVISSNNPLIRAEQGDAPGELARSDFENILSTFRFTNASATGGTRFSSKYFTLSFMVPPGFIASEDQNEILISDIPLIRRGIGDSSAFFSLTRYGSTDPKQRRVNNATQFLKNSVGSTITIDGSPFFSIEGVDDGRFEGESAGRVLHVFFDASSVEVIERPANTDVDFDPIAISKQILATFKFTN